MATKSYHLYFNLFVAAVNATPVFDSTALVSASTAFPSLNSNESHKHGRVELTEHDFTRRRKAYDNVVLTNQLSSSGAY